MSGKRTIITPTWPKDENGMYIKEEPPKTAAPPPALTVQDVLLDDILKRQLTALSRVTRQLVLSATAGYMTKDEIQSLATCIKVTMELKMKENELLEALTDEDLEKIAKNE